MPGKGELSPLPEPYAHALLLIDQAHSRDPNLVQTPRPTDKSFNSSYGDAAGHEELEATLEAASAVPYELHYAKKMTRWLSIRCPGAGPELQLACRAQHFQRYVFCSCVVFLGVSEVVFVLGSGFVCAI